MKYTTEKALAEIMLRSEQIVIRKNRKSCRVLSCTAGVLLAALTLIIALLPGKANVEYSDSIYGSFLLSREAGGYVLASVRSLCHSAVFEIPFFETAQIQKNKKS